MNDSAQSSFCGGTETLSGGSRRGGVQPPNSFTRLRANPLSGAFAKLRKATISFVMFVRLSIQPFWWKQLGSHSTDLIKFDILVFFENLSRKIQVSLKSDKTSVYFTWRPVHIFYHTLCTCSWNEKFLGQSCRENQNTLFVFNNFFFRKSCRLWDNVEEYCRAVQTTNDNMAHAHCMLHTSSYKYTFRIYNTHCCPTATMVTRTLLIVTLYVRCLSC